MSVVTNECTEYRQRIQQILDAGITLKHVIDLDQYITVTETAGKKTFTIDNQLFIDVVKLMWPETFYQGWSTNELLNFISSSYGATLRYKALLYTECKDLWQNLYKDQRLKIEIMLGDSFFFGRQVTETILDELSKTCYILGLDDVMIDIPFGFGPERISDKLAYGCQIRWVCKVAQQLLDANLKYNYGAAHNITGFDMIYGFQIYSRLFAMIENELLTNYKPTVNDIFIAKDKTFTLFCNTIQRCLYWQEQVPNTNSEA